MALRLLRLVRASASARGLAAGAQRVVSGGWLSSLGSSACPRPDTPALLIRPLSYELLRPPPTAQGAAGLTFPVALGEPRCQSRGAWARVLIRSVIGEAALSNAL